MKKLLIFGLIFCLLFSSVVFAAEAPANSVSTASQALDAGKQAISNSNVGQVEIPENFASVLRMIFNIPSSEDITLSYTVILLAWTIFFLLIISSLMEFVPFFEGWKAWIGSLVVVLLIAFSGGIRDSVQLFLAFQLNLGIFASLSFIFIAVIMVIIGLALTKLLKIIKDKVGIDTAKQVGQNISIKPLRKKLKEDGFK